MSLLTSLARWLPEAAVRYVPLLAKAKPTLPRAEMLALRPVRNPVIAWERRASESGTEDDFGEPGPVVLHVPRRDDARGRLLSRLLQIPATKTIELDEFGSAVWELCDGAHTVAQLVRHTCDTYQLNRRQGEVSVTTFMRILAQRRLIGFLPGGKASSHGGNSNSESVQHPKRARRPARTRRR